MWAIGNICMECTEHRGTALRASPCAFLPCHLLAVAFSNLLGCCYNLKILLFTCKHPWCQQQLPVLMSSWAFSDGVELPCASLCLCSWLGLWLHEHGRERGWKAARHSVSAEQQERATSTSPSTAWVRWSKTPGQGETCAAEGAVGKKPINIQWRKRENTFWLQLWL